MTINLMDWYIWWEITDENTLHQNVRWNLKHNLWLYCNLTCFSLIWLIETTENGHQEERVDEEKEDIAEPSDSVKNTELEENQEKSNEPLDDVNKESVTDEPLASSLELQAAENPVESPKEEQQEYGVEYQDPTTDVGLQEDESDLKEQSASADQLTSRRMEVPSNKVRFLTFYVD